MAKRIKAGKTRIAKRSLVELLVSNPRRVPGLRVVAGFRAESDKAGLTRLYPTARFDEYLEFPTKSVVHTEPLVGAEFPLGGSLVWMHRDAKIGITKAGRAQAHGKFLRGSITSTLLDRLSPDEITTLAGGRLHEVRSKDGSVSIFLCCSHCCTSQVCRTRKNPEEQTCYLHYSVDATC